MTFPKLVDTLPNFVDNNRKVLNLWIIFQKNLRIFEKSCTFAPELFTRNKEMNIDTTNMCSHLQRKLFAPDGEYRAIREQIESDPTLTAVVRSRQLHIYRDGKKILVLAGKSAPKIIREDRLTELL